MDSLVISSASMPAWASTTCASVWPLKPQLGMSSHLAISTSHAYARTNSGELYDDCDVAMSSVLGPCPMTNGAPGALSWCMTRPKSASARPSVIWPAVVIGAVPPATGEGQYVDGMPRSAQ